MPDDPLIPNASGQAGGDPPQPDAAAPAQGVDAETLQRIVAEQVELQTTSLREQNESLQREVTGLRQQAQQAQQTAGPNPDPYAGGSNDDLLSSFMANPDEVLTAKVTAVMEPMFKQFASQMAPIVQQVNTGMSTTLTEQHRRQVDSEFGAGTFDEKFKPLLDRRIKAETDIGQPLRASDGPWMESEIAAIKGHLFTDLIDRRAAHQKAVAEGREQEHNTLADTVTKRVTALGPGGIGSQFFSAEGTEPTPEEQKFLDARDAVTGGTANGEPTYAEMREASTFDDFDSYQAAMAAKANGRPN
jgi:uncharacterized protein YheU (UPF0270 family)